jgi:hypothetical protein
VHAQLHVLSAFALGVPCPLHVTALLVHASMHSVPLSV